MTKQEAIASIKADGWPEDQAIPDAYVRLYMGSTDTSHIDSIGADPLHTSAQVKALLAAAQAEHGANGPTAQFTSIMKTALGIVQKVAPAAALL